MLSEQDIISENKAIAREYKELLRISYQSLSEDDKKLIRLAFDTAVEAHSDQRRKSGEAYIFHPIAVAKIVASEIGLDATSIAAALLHDVVEDTSYMFVTGPNVVKTVTHEEVTSEELGGASTHSSKSGVAHFSCANEVDLINELKTLLSYMPQNCEEEAPALAYNLADEKREELNIIIPDNPNQPYDIKEVIEELTDKDSFYEVHKKYAENIVCGFARLAGKSIGIVANQPAFLAGVLNIEASTKAARFVRFCDCFNIPLLVLEDVPGFLPGTDQEWRGIITHGAKLLYAFSEATVPRITVITRKAYGGAYDVMNSKHIGADMNYAWPCAEIAVMGAKGAAEIIFKKEIKEADDKKAKWEEKEKEYAALFANPYNAAARGYVDEVIEPAKTREKLIKAFKMLENKVAHLPKKKHGNIPL